MVKTRNDEFQELPRWEIPDVATADGANVAMPSKSQLELIREKYSKEGFDAGFQKGYQEGQQAVTLLQNQLKGLIESLADPLAMIDAQIEEQLLQMIQVICSRILRKALSTDPEFLLQLIRDSKNAFMDNKKLVIYLPPKELELVKSILSVDDQETMELVEDADIAEGSCRIKTKTATIHADLENRIDNLMKGDARDV